jgi:hypothetical protein
LVFKSQDLEDQISAVNHMQTGLLRTVQLWDDVAVLLGAGYIFAQTESFRDPDGSDYFTAGVVSWKPTDWLGVENTALFFDMSASMKLVNRLLLSGQVRGFGVDLYLWERVEFDEDRAATSAALAVTLPTTRLNETMSLKTTLTYLGYLSHTKPAFAQRNGFVLSLAAPMSFKHAPLS